MEVIVQTFHVFASNKPIILSSGHLVHIPSSMSKEPKDMHSLDRGMDRLSDMVTMIYHREMVTARCNPGRLTYILKDQAKKKRINNNNGKRMHSTWIERLKLCILYYMHCIFKHFNL